MSLSIPCLCRYGATNYIVELFGGLYHLVLTVLANVVCNTLCISLLSVILKYTEQLSLGIIIDYILCSLCLPVVHPHIQWSINPICESSIRIIELI